MTTKTDIKWSQDTAENVLAMGREIERLEGILDRIELFLDPNRSVGVCTEHMVKNQVTNMRSRIETLEKELEGLGKGRH